MRKLLLTLAIAICGLPIGADAQERKGKTCAWDGMPSPSIKGFDCYLQRGSFTYSSHNSPYVYIPNCDKPSDSYVISGYAVNGKCPDGQCRDELTTLLKRVCK